MNKKAINKTGHYIPTWQVQLPPAVFNRTAFSLWDCVSAGFPGDSTFSKYVYKDPCGNRERFMGSWRFFTAINNLANINNHWQSYLSWFSAHFAPFISVALSNFANRVFVEILGQSWLSRWVVNEWVWKAFANLCYCHVILCTAFGYHLCICSLSFEVNRDMCIKLLPLVSFDVSQIPNLWKERPRNLSEIYLIKNSIVNKHWTSCINSFC